MNRWQRRWKRIKNVPGLAKNLTAVLVGIVVGVVALVYVLANVKFIAPWEDRVELSAVFESADAVNPDAAPKVRIAGVDVGQVIDVELTDDGKARVRLSLEPGHTVYSNATALLRPKSVLNEMYVEIAPGGAPGTPLTEGGEIPATRTERPVQADEVFEHLDQRTRDALGNLLSMSDVALANAPETLPAALREFDTALSTWSPVLTKLATRRERIAQLVTSVSLIAEATGRNRERASRLTTSLEQTLTTLSQRQDALVAGLAEVPGLGDDLRAASGSVSALASELNPTLRNVRAASETLPPTLRRLQSTVGNARETLRTARPVVAKARPLLNLMGPVVSDARTSFDQLAPMSERVDPALDTLMPYLTDLRAFIYNTSGVFTASDATGGMIRGHVAVPLPYGAVIPGTNGGNPSPIENR